MIVAPRLAAAALAALVCCIAPALAQVQFAQAQFAQVQQGQPLPPPQAQPLPPPQAQPAPSPPGQQYPPPQRQPGPTNYGPDELVGAGHKFFGNVSRGLASIIERAVSQWGLPNG